METVYYIIVIKLEPDRHVRKPKANGGLTHYAAKGHRPEGFRCIGHLVSF